MPIRLSGLMSGMDTEGIVKELMSAQSLKKKKVEKAKTKLEWKQTKWSELNTKLIKLYNEQVSKMQFSTAYRTKKASVSDPTKASVTAGTNAVNGNYTMEINHIATTQYLTGGRISAKSASEKLVDIDSSLLNKEIRITSGNKTTNFTVTGDTKISDFVSALKDAGLNASYDVAQQRLFISSKKSGVENGFSITSPSATELNAQNEVFAAVGYDKMSSDNKAVVDNALVTLRSATVGSDEYEKALSNLAKASYDTTTSLAKSGATSYVKAELYSDNYTRFYNDALSSGSDAEAAKKKAEADTEAFVNQEIANNEGVKLRIHEVACNGKTADEIRSLDSLGREKYFGTELNAISGFDGTMGLTEDSVKSNISAVVASYASLQGRDDTSANSALYSLGLANIQMDASGVAKVVGSAPSEFAMIEASDSEIVLNGAKLKSSESKVSVNGLSIELTGVTKPGEVINFSVTNDVDAVYNSIKTALKEYNTLMEEMNKLYNAESSKGYEPLTSEEKEAMNDSDVELWEKKIKDSLLRRDSTLGDLMQSMRSVMMSTVKYDGKSYALSSFGIMTSTNYSEGGMLHIYGDKDDSTYADRDDKLKKALEENPDAVMTTLSDIFANLRKTMGEKMSSKQNMSSALTFYNDIQMKKDVTKYKDEIEDWEDRLATMEDAYYKKFTAMETALAKLQAQQSSLGNLFGN